MLRHPRAGARTRSSTCSTSCSACCATSGWTTSTSSCPPATTQKDKFIGDRRAVGERDRRAARGRRPSPGSSSCPTRAAPRSTARRSPSRRATRSAAPGRCRPIQVDFNLPERLRARVHRPRTAPASSPVMIHRALFGSIERFFGDAARALRRRVPGVAVAGAGGRHPGGRGVRRLPRRGRRPAARPTASAPSSTRLDDRMQKKIRTHTTQQGAVHAHRGGAGPRGGHRVSFRFRDGAQENGVPIADAVAPHPRRDRRPARRSTRGRHLRARTTTADRVRGGRRMTAARPRRGAGRVPAALDAAPDGVHPGDGPAAPTRTTCPFCGAPDAERRARRSSSHRGDAAYVLLNLFPYNSGHLLVCPYRHVAELRRGDRRGGRRDRRRSRRRRCAC